MRRVLAFAACALFSALVAADALAKNAMHRPEIEADGGSCSAIDARFHVALSLAGAACVAALRPLVGYLRTSDARRDGMTE